MQINYTADAFNSLIQLVNFIESKNTFGAGLRWLTRFEDFLEKKLHNPEHIRLCSNYTFNQLNLRCVYFNDWLVAFSIHENTVLIEALLHNPVSKISKQIFLLHKVRNAQVSDTTDDPMKYPKPIPPTKKPAGPKPIQVFRNIIYYN